jgi:nucleoside-diphosphate-sugar epimerase
MSLRPFRIALSLLSLPAASAWRALTGWRLVSHRNSGHVRSPPLAVASGGENRAIIVQNKGGGHGEIGYQLALHLMDEKGLEVTILHDGGPERKRGAEPFDSYSEAGLDVLWADLGARSVHDALEDRGPFEFVFDNWAKDVNSATSIVKLAKLWDVSNYIFVSSAGMYTGLSQPMREGDEVKATGQRAVEEFLDLEGLPWTSFRPQYIYGPKTNKRTYIDWFFDRVVRDLPVPIPNDGNQLVSLTNAVDIAKLLAAVIGNPAAVGEVFNCATDKLVSYNNLAKMVGDVCGKADVICEHYNPFDFDLPKGAFPFRDDAFFVDVSKAKSILAWTPESTLENDLRWYYEDYLKLGLDKKAQAFISDEKVKFASSLFINTRYMN